MYCDCDLSELFCYDSMYACVSQEVRTLIDCLPYLGTIEIADVVAELHSYSVLVGCHA